MSDVCAGNGASTGSLDEGTQYIQFFCNDEQKAKAKGSSWTQDDVHENLKEEWSRTCTTDEDCGDNLYCRETIADFENLWIRSIGCSTIEGETWDCNQFDEVTYRFKDDTLETFKCSAPGNAAQFFGELTFANDNITTKLVDGLQSGVDELGIDADLEEDFGVTTILISVAVFAVIVLVILICIYRRCRRCCSKDKSAKSRSSQYGDDTVVIELNRQNDEELANEPPVQK